VSASRLTRSADGCYRFVVQMSQHECRLLGRLREARTAQGLSLRETAKAADIDPAHLSRVERGLANLSVHKLSQLAGVLGLHDLMAGLQDLASPDEEAGRTRSQI